MTDESVRRLLTERLPAPPPGMAEPPLAAIRRRARRRTGTQVAMVGVMAAAIAGGAVVWASGSTPALSGADAPTATATTDAPPAMFYPSYLPPGYRADTGGSDTELRFLNAAENPPIPLVIRRLPAGAQVPAEGPALRTATVRGRPAEVLPIDAGGITLTWVEGGSRFTVSFEAPPNTQIDFAIDETVARLTAVAEGLGPRR
jgi:hypothetical protein